ncbi:MAG TPA: permease, partial [Planctomycetaceae bacterium]|nr:permease [Planctomycetaceae bacterium]
MDVVLGGALVRVIQGLVSSMPTLIVGLFIAAVLKYYLRIEGTLKLFGGTGWRSLAQSWLIGMLLPVCSIGVIPIIRQLRQMGLRPGAITAFALSAPLFNPLSLLYGLTLSRPYVIVGFALASLAVVTLLGMIWDRVTGWRPAPIVQEATPISLRRLGFCGLFMARELFGPSGLLTLIALLGLAILAGLLPHGALQSSVEQDNPAAPLVMASVAVPIYATPMLTMSQLGMMFHHGNSPGAAFCLLLLGTGVNLATLWWTAAHYGLRSTCIWFVALFGIVLACAYAVDRPLIPPGVEPAGHTHAFDIYTNPFHSDSTVTPSSIWQAIQQKTTSIDLTLTCIFLAMAGLVGGLSRTLIRGPTERFLRHIPDIESQDWYGMHRKVSARAVGMTCLAGLVALSVVGCYAYYPAPDEVQEEMRIVRVEILSGASSRDLERVLHFTPELERWTRMLEVGYF